MSNNKAPKQAANLLKTRTQDHPRNQSRSQLAASSTTSSSSRSTSRHQSHSQTRERLNHSDELDLRSPVLPAVHNSRSLDEVSDESHQHTRQTVGLYTNNLNRQPTDLAIHPNNQLYANLTEHGSANNHNHFERPPRVRASAVVSDLNNGRKVGVPSSNGCTAVSPGEDNIQDLLTCTVCFELYDDDEHQPKLLSCHHSLCKQCILQLISAAGSRSSSTSSSKTQRVVCPTCRNTTALPPAPTRDASVARMQTNFYVAQMKDLIGCAGQSRSTNELQNCPRHKEEVLEWFCRSCGMSVCAECRATDHSEINGHVVKTITDVTSEELDLMKMEMTSAWRLVANSNDHIKRLKTEVSCLLAAKQRAERDICTEFTRYAELLKQRRLTLLNHINTEYNGRATGLQSDIECTLKSLSSLSCVVEKCQEASNSGSVNAIIAYRTSLRSKCRSLANVDVNARTRTNLIAFSVVDTSRQIDELIGTLGRISCERPLPNFIKVTDCQAIACRQSTASLYFKDICGENIVPCEIYIDVEIRDSDDDLIVSTFERKSDTFLLTFLPQISGLHRIAVKFCNLPLPGTTQYLQVLSNDPVEQIGDCATHCEGEEDDDDDDDVMQYPRDIAVDVGENIYVADSGNNRILKYDSMGRIVGKFSISTDDDDDLSSCGIAVDNERSVLICTEVSLSGADLMQAHTILRFTLEGQLLNRLSYEDLLHRALSVAVNSQGTVIIADLDGNAVCLFDSSGRFLKKFGATGSKPGQLNHPNFVCVGTDDSIVVSDGDNHRIQVFDRGGNFLFTFGERGTKKGKFNLPFGVAVDSLGNIVVVDGGNRRIQVFTAGGKLLGCIESLGDPLSAPRGVALTHDGYVLIADRDNHCIKKYRYLSPCTSTQTNNGFEVSVL